jgi:L-Ala-D/L-Glu epimerase
MNLTRVRIVRYKVPFREPYLTAAGSATHREGFIVQLESDTGLWGLGEGTLLPHEALGIEELGEMIRDAAGSLLSDGLDAFLASDQDEDAGGNSLAWAPVSIAAWDLRARAQGLPLAMLLNPGASTRATVNALIGGGPREAVEQAAQIARSAGYRTVKLKVGVADSLAAEVARVEACRSAIGPAIRLRLDANGAWDEEQAIETLIALAPNNLEYVEQPMVPGDPEGLRRIREATAIRIAADEDVTDQASARRVLRAVGADVLVLKPLQAGGIGRTCIIAGEAAKYGVDVTITTSIDSGIGTAAALHLAAARGGQAHGLGTLMLLEDDLLEGGLPIEQGLMYLPAAPGLGVELDEAALKRYTVDEWEIRP